MLPAPRARPSPARVDTIVPFLPPSRKKQEWVCLFDTLPKEWMESVQLVLDYFCERTPR
jgi:hypothetical protein